MRLFASILVLITLTNHSIFHPLFKSYLSWYVWANIKFLMSAFLCLSVTSCWYIAQLTSHPCMMDTLSLLCFICSLILQHYDLESREYYSKLFLPIFLVFIFPIIMWFISIYFPFQWFSSVNIRSLEIIEPYSKIFR